MTIYLIVDEHDCYGAGKTSDEAWAEARGYAEEVGGSSAEEMFDEIIFQAEWPKNAAEMDGNDWLNYRRENE